MSIIITKIIILIILIYTYIHIYKIVFSAVL